jgi:hypothetical protein
MTRLVLAALALTMLTSALPLAHPGHDHKLMGTLISVDGTTLVVKTTEGKDLTVTVIPTTSFKRGKAKGALADLKVGLRVVVNVGNGSEPLKAKDIQYAAPVTTAQK